MDGDVNQAGVRVGEEERMRYKKETSPVLHLQLTIVNTTSIFKLFYGFSSSEGGLKQEKIRIKSTFK